MDKDSYVLMREAILLENLVERSVSGKETAKLYLRLDANYDNTLSVDEIKPYRNKLRADIKY